MKIRQQAFLCTIGTALEWYDFSLFASLASIIASLFFPADNHVISLLNTFGVFATGYLMRPVGAFFFGHLGDKYGRKSTLFITIVLMAIATTGIGLVPVLDGNLVSALIILALRLLQGFAASGEYPGGITLLYELAAPGKKGFITSFGLVAALAGILVGTLTCEVFSKLLTHEEMLAWGWRVPFLLGAPFGLIGYLIRRNLLESEEFQRAQDRGATHKIPLIELFRNYPREFLIVLFLYVLQNVAFYINFMYLSAYTVTINKITVDQALFLNVLTTLVYAAFVPLSGFMSDRVNKKMIMLVAAALFVVSSYPLFYFALSGSYGAQIISQVLLSVIIGTFAGPLAYISAEKFPTTARYTGVSLTLNIGASVFGGSAPLIAVWISNLTGNPVLSSFYLIAIGIATTIACLFL